MSTPPMDWAEAHALLEAESSRVLSGSYRRALQGVVAVGRTVDLLDTLADDRDKDAANLKKRGSTADYIEGRRDGYRKAVALIREELGAFHHPITPPDDDGTSPMKGED